MVSDNLRCAILVTRAPVALRNQLLLIASRDLDWTDVKRSAMDFLLATTFSTAPMDIGHVNGGKPYEGGKPYGGGRYKGGRGKGKDEYKGKGGKGKGKDDQKGKGKWAGKEKFEGAADADDGAIARRTATRRSTTRRLASLGRRTPSTTTATRSTTVGRGTALVDGGVERPDQQRAG